MRALVTSLLAASVAVASCAGQRVATTVPVAEVATRGGASDVAQPAARETTTNAVLTKLQEVPAPAPAPAPAVAVLPAKVADDMPTMRHLYQSLNNCGPASVVMLLSTLGVTASQEDARLALRGPDVRRGMGPQGVDPWINEHWGVRSAWRNNGSVALLKQLITNGFSPMVTQWMQDTNISRIAHWRAVRGYDDDRGVFYVNDPMLGRGVPLSYAWFDKHWQPFSYRYLVMYRPEDEAKVKAIIGADWNDKDMRRNFYERTKRDALAQNTDGAWLAYGEASYQYGMFAEALAAIEKGMSMTSAQPFTLRSSYPAVLRALGRQADAQAAAERMNRIALVPSATVAAPPVSDAIMELVREREREAWYALLPEQERPTR